MRKTVLALILQIISVISFAFSEGREICNTVGTTTNCEIEGIIIPVTLEVPKSVYIVKEFKEFDFDFGEVIKGENATASSSFKLKGDIGENVTLKIYQNSSEVIDNNIILGNGKDSVAIKIDSLNKGTNSGDEIPVNMTLKLNGAETTALSSGEYRGTFTVRAIIN